MLRAAHTTWKTDTGRQRRDNEDNAFARAPLFVIADGMGGAQAGEVASKLAVEAFQGELPDSGSPEERLANRARDANRKIYEISRSEHERAGMGTTLTAVYVDDADLAVAHVGDSRAYLFRHGELGRLTQDHTLVEELVRRGKLTEEQAAEHPQRSIITRALGVDPEVDVDTRTYAARAGDVVLLCSDGLTSMISEDEIVAILEGEHDLDRAAERLIAAANEAGGRDNITVILFRLEEVGDSPAGDQPTEVGLTPAASSPDPGGQPSAPGSAPSATLTAPRTQAPPELGPKAAAPLARTQGRKESRAGRRGRGPRRFARTAAALLTVLIVLALIGAGGYLATRQLFFVGTNSQGLVTIYRGLPYDLPLGAHLYESFYVSGVPVSVVPGARRAKLLDHHLRSQADAISLVHTAELGQLAK
ncbi:MAG: Stp1/IreP family PP2C-type Ser/Thr phosphatase [Solirubrobacteraceae bacterium]